MRFHPAPSALLALYTTPILTESFSSSPALRTTLSRTAPQHNWPKSTQPPGEEENAVSSLQERVGARTAMTDWEELGCLICRDATYDSLTDYELDRPVEPNGAIRWSPPAVSEMSDLVGQLIADDWYPGQNTARCNLLARPSTSVVPDSLPSRPECMTVIGHTTSAWSTLAAQQQYTSTEKVTARISTAPQLSRDTHFISSLSWNPKRVNGSIYIEQLPSYTTSSRSSIAMAPPVSWRSLLTSAVEQSQLQTNVPHFSLQQHPDGHQAFTAHLQSSAPSSSVFSVNAVSLKSQSLVAISSLKQHQPISAPSEPINTSPSSTSTNFVTATGIFTITSLHKTTASPVLLVFTSSDGLTHEPATSSIVEITGFTSNDSTESASKPTGSTPQPVDDASQFTRRLTKPTQIPPQPTQDDISSRPHEDSAAAFDGSPFAFTIAVLVWLIV